MLNTPLISLPLHCSPRVVRRLRSDPYGHCNSRAREGKNNTGAVVFLYMQPQEEEVTFKNLFSAIMAAIYMAIHINQQNRATFVSAFVELETASDLLGKRATALHPGT